MIINLLFLTLYLGLVSSDLVSLSNLITSDPTTTRSPHQFPLSEKNPNPQENTQNPLLEPMSPLFSALSITKEDIENFEKLMDQIERVKNVKISQNGLPFGHGKKNKNFSQKIHENGGLPFGHGKKRHVTQSGLDIYGQKKQIFCGPGRMYMDSRLMDKCIGKHCSISILQCGNHTYQYNSTFTGDLQNCTVQQIVCLDPSDNNDTILVDLQGECYLHKVKCNDLEVNVTTVENLKLFQCQVQVLCGTTVYGWEAFGYNCKSDELFCEGKKVDHPESEEVNSRCEIRSKGCSTFGHNSSDTCHVITTVCTNSPTEQVCNQQIQDHRIKCLQNHTNNRCVPDKIVCGGTVYSASTYTGSLALCESVQSLSCSAVGQVVFPTQGVFCRIVELACNGTIIPYTNQPDIPPTCSISKVMCSSFTNFLDCTTHHVGCIEDTGCHYVDRVLPCQNECTQLGPVPACACPVDYTGEFCQDFRTLGCNLTMVAPGYNCVPNRLFAPQICLQFDKKDKLTLIYSLSCGFQEFNLNQAQNDGFQYSFIGDQFALTENPEDYFISMKIFNFDVFSDNKQTLDLTLNADYFLERKFLSFEVDLNTVDPGKYMAGNMMYLEYRLKSKQDFRPTLHHGVVGREYIEITGLPPIKTNSTIKYKWIIFGLVTGILCVGIIAYVVYRRIRKMRKLKKKQT